MRNGYNTDMLKTQESNLGFVLHMTMVQIPGLYGG